MFGLSYWFLPLFSGCIWLGTLLAMMLVWVRQGKPVLSDFSSTQYIPYISDLGATSWGKPTFIAGSATAIVVFTVTFATERWLRHKGRLAKNYNKSEKILSVFATLFAIVGAAGLILLTIFDTVNYPRVHVSMLGVFIIGYIISAIFITSEYQRLGVRYREHPILAYSFWIKLAFIFIEVALAITFGVMSREKRYNTAAIMEWTVSLIFIFYMWSFIIDFLPAVHTRHRSDRFGAHVRRAGDKEAGMHEAGGNMMGGPVYSNGGAVDNTSYHSQAPTLNASYNTPSRNF